jgi:hypothetical protein
MTMAGCLASPLIAAALQSRLELLLHQFLDQRGGSPEVAR